MNRKFPAILAAGLLLSGCTVASCPLSHSRHRRQAALFGTDWTMERYIVPEGLEPRLSRQELVKLLRKRVKYVFVLYQENRSFDSYFGTFPGAEGLFSQPAAETPGFYQTFTDTSGKQITIHPFRIGPTVSPCGEVTRCYAADTDDIDHSHRLMAEKMDVVDGVPHMDKFAQIEEDKYWTSGRAPSLKAKQMGELAMAYEDGNTVPFLWRYANRFVLFDHIFQLMVGPSTPGNLSIFAAQTGQTQAALHPGSDKFTGDGNSGPGDPVLNDSNPFWGSSEDMTPVGEKMPYNGGGTPQINQTYATLALSLAGEDAEGLTLSDRDPGTDLEDVSGDISFLTRHGQRSIPWGWYEEGFDHEPTDPNDPTDANGTHASYITHHNGPQYFGYIADNPQESKNLHGLEDFFNAVQNGNLPADGGIFFVKGGYDNIFGLKPVDPDPLVQANFVGDDDHPAYSDAQISEALVAKAVNAIAGSKYWDKCAIIITWDDSEGDYDSLPPPIRSYSYSSDHDPITDGPRVPMILISPYARVHCIDSNQGDHGSVVKFADALFGLKPLAELPDELNGRKLGLTEFGQVNWGPDDAITKGVCNLTSAFDPARLAGRIGPLPPSYAIIPDRIVDVLPQKSGYGLEDIHLTPTDYALGIHNDVPPDFNPRPKTDPTALTSP